MLVAGVDVGAENISAVILQDSDILSFCTLSLGGEGAVASREAVEEAVKKTGFGFANLQQVIATGCGRNSVPFANSQSTEVVCQARGAFWLFPSTRTVINLGAESSRAIRVGETGRVQAFAKNDKCAAGSGVFLESMSRLLQVPIHQMGELALKAEQTLNAQADTSLIEYDEDGDPLPAKGVEVSSRCAVFAESEVISHIHKGVPKDRILVSLHKAVAGRILEILGTVGIKSDVVVTGGVAKNKAIIKELENRIGLSIIVPPEPQVVGALGAALLARDKVSQH